jgi:predicted DNA-binding protein YlxM (UPF0122 family)
VEEFNIADAINQYGFPIIAAFGLGYFIFYIWRWVTEDVDPVVEESHMTLIALIDRIRMLDNDLIRMQTKLDILLREVEKREIYEEAKRDIAAADSDTNIQ